MNTNTISQLFDLLDDKSTVTDIKVSGNIKYIAITRNLNHNMICTLCAEKLYSKGLFTRYPNNQNSKMDILLF